GGGATAVATAEAASTQAPRLGVGIETVEDITTLLAGQRNLKLQKEVEDFVSVVSLRPGVLEFNPLPGAPADLAGRLGQALTALTGQRWAVAVTESAGEETIRARNDATNQALLDAALAHPMVLSALDAFEGAEILEVRPLGAASSPAQDEFLAPMVERDEIEGDLVVSDDEWDDDPWKENI
ncbi:MAG: hypothetical protein AAF503_08425, partial [Pseudomonadota bacterium]